MRCMRAFTLIELLVVMAVVAVLATMSMAGIRHIRERLRDNQTVDRIEACLTAFTQIGQGEGSGALVIQRDAGLDGVLGWVSWKTSQAMAGAAGTSEEVHDTRPDPNYWINRRMKDPFASSRRGENWDGIAYADPGLGGKDDGSKPYLRFPWGETVPSELQKLGREVNIQPDTFYLRHMSTNKTREILTVAGIVPKPVNATVKKYREYMTDRSVKRDWNDAWGRPLVVAFAMYHPPKNSSKDNGNTATNDPDRWDTILRVCRDKYRRTRTVYLAVAACGPTLPPMLKEEDLTTETEARWVGASGIPHAIWTRIVGDGVPSNSTTGVVGICQQGTAVSVRPRVLGGTPPPHTTGEWTEKSWSNPPWSGVKLGKYVDPKDKINYRCFLSHPISLN